MSRECSNKPHILNKYEKHIMQLYKALNRQYSKEAAINIVVNFIFKKLGFNAMYLDIIEDSQTIIIKESSCASEITNIQPKSDQIVSSGVFNLNLVLDEYKKVLHLDNFNSIENAFPVLNKMIKPYEFLSTPVFARSKLVGLLVIYVKEKNKKISWEIINLAKLATRELTAVFSRIDRQNLAFENMLGLTALESILLYNPQDDIVNANDPLNKIVSVISSTTGMKKCTIALLDDDRE